MCREQGNSVKWILKLAKVLKILAWNDNTCEYCLSTLKKIISECFEILKSLSRKDSHLNETDTQPEILEKLPCNSYIQIESVRFY